MVNTLSIPQQPATHPGAEFFRLFLDPTMTHSGAYFSRDDMTLEEAQLAKYERLCSRLQLCETDHVLELGSGWGGYAIYMARHYGCQVTTLTLSQQQYDFVTRRINAAGLDDRVTVLCEDYRSLSGQWDKIVSVELFENAGDQELEVYFRKCREWLKRDGILALQAITCTDGGFLPSMEAIHAAVKRTGDWILADAKDLALHYAATLKIWFMQFNSRIAEVRALGFDDPFIRQWNHYFCCYEAAFRMRNLQAMQLVYTYDRLVPHREIH